MVILVEFGLVTPPIGFNLFVFTLFPQIVTFLPNYF
jgi:TRAP-type C4-dicarboxylate transport system permease large subunit